MDDYTRSMLKDQIPEHRLLLVEGAMREMKELVDRIHKDFPEGVPLDEYRQRMREQLKKDVQAICEKYGLPFQNFLGI